MSKVEVPGLGVCIFASAFVVYVGLILVGSTLSRIADAQEWHLNRECADRYPACVVGVDTPEAAR